MNIGAKIRKLREEKNLSIEELATKINDTIENINKYENDELEPTLDKKLALANILGTSLDNLMVHNSPKIKKPVDDSVISRYEDTIDEEEPIEEIKQEEKIEEPIGISNIEYNDNVFDVVFLGQRKPNFFLQIFYYVISLAFSIYLYTTELQVLAIIFGIISFIGFAMVLLKFFSYRKVKKGWLAQYGGQKRKHIFYEDYLVVKSESGEEKEILYYQDFQSFIEQENYLIGMVSQSNNVKLILIINKYGFENNNYEEIKQTIKEKCISFTELPPLRGRYSNDTSQNDASQNDTSKNDASFQNQMPQKENSKWNTVLWIIFIFAILSIEMVRFIFNLCTGGDATLLTNLLIYGLGLILPIASIVLGFISEIHFKKRSRKNIIIGFVVLFVCVIQIISSVSYHLTYTGNNDSMYQSKLETLFEIDLPDNYYTIYKDESLQKLTIENNEYKQENYQIVRFVKAKEIKNLEETIKNNWDKVETAHPFCKVTDDIKKELMLTGVTLSDVSSYSLSKENETSQIYLFYYEKENVMISISYQK